MIKEQDIIESLEKGKKHYVLSQGVSFASILIIINFVMLYLSSNEMKLVDMVVYVLICLIGGLCYSFTTYMFFSKKYQKNKNEG